MLGIVLWVVGGLAALIVLDLQSIFNPSTREVMEVKYEQREEQDESGAPPGGEP